MAAKVLPPIKITAAMVTASSVAEPDTATGEVAWNAATYYSIGDKVTRSTKNRVYTSKAAGVDAGLPEDTPLRWKDTKPTNKMAAFDNYRSTPIRTNGTLTQTVEPGIMTDQAFYGLEGDVLTMVCKNRTSGTVYFTETYSLGNYTTGDLEWEFWFGNPVQQGQLRIMGLPPKDAKIELTLTPSLETGWAGIGLWAIGSFADIGDPQFGFKAKLVDYSYIDIDEDTGEVVIEKGLSAKDLQGTCVTSSDNANAVNDLVTNLLGVPCAVVISGLTKYDYLSVFGLLTADVSPDNEGEATVSLTARGFI